MNTNKMVLQIGENVNLSTKGIDSKTGLQLFYRYSGTRSTDGNSSLLEYNGNWVVMTQNPQSGSDAVIHFASQRNNTAVTSGADAISMANSLTYVTLENLEIII